MAGNTDKVVFVPFYDFIFCDIVDHADQFYWFTIFVCFGFSFDVQPSQYTISSEEPDLHIKASLGLDMLDCGFKGRQVLCIDVWIVAFQCPVSSVLVFARIRIFDHGRGT